MKHYAQPIHYLAWLLLGYSALVVLLINAILTLKRTPIYLSQVAPCTPLPEPLLHKSRPKEMSKVSTGRLPIGSIPHSLPIRLPDYPRYRTSRLKGARTRLRPSKRRMSLHSYLIAQQRKMTSRWTRVRNQRLKQNPMAEHSPESMTDSSMD